MRRGQLSDKQLKLLQLINVMHIDTCVLIAIAANSYSKRPGMVSKVLYPLVPSIYI